MKTLIIRNYMEKVTNENLGTEANPFYKVDMGNYELVSVVRFPDDNRSVKQLVKHGRRNNRFESWIRNGYCTKPVSSYGVKSYQEVSLEVQ